MPHIRFINSKLKNKLLVLFILILIVPLLTTNALWFFSTGNQITESTSKTLSSDSLDVAHQIEGYFQTKIQGLLIHSQTDSVLNQNYPEAVAELQNLIKQDEDIQELTLLDPKGMEQIHLNRNRVYTQNELIDQSSSPAFKIPTFVSGEIYISPVYIDQNGDPNVYIAMPIIKPENSKELQTLNIASVGNYRLTGEIHGVLKENINLKFLWNKIAAFKIGQSGYVYIIDRNGNVIAHPDLALARQQKNLRGIQEVDRFLADRQRSNETKPQETIHKSLNEKGVESLSINTYIRFVDWGVIAQIPISDTLAQTRQAAMFGFLIFLAVLIMSIPIDILISNKILKPLQQLREGAILLGSGNLNYRLNVKTSDEIEDLGNSFNKMADNLQQAFLKLEQDRNIISGEKNKLAVTISSVADAVIAVDLNRRVTLLNKSAEKLLGVKFRDALNRPLGQVLNLFDENGRIEEAEYCPIRTDGFEGTIYSKEGLKLVTEYDFLNNDFDTTSGRLVPNPDFAKMENQKKIKIYKEYYVNLISAQIHEAVTSNLGCILTLHDVTKEKELEEMKLDFVSMAAHELRTPLTSISGYLEVLMHEIKEKLSPEHQIFLGRIKISTQQLKGLVESLLSVSKIERGVFTINPQPLDWLDLVTQTGNELLGRAAEKGLKLEIIYPKQPLKLVLADKLRINEVVINLISNAINYTQKGSIRVWFEQTPTEVITHVQDTGQGIPKDAIPKLFTKFFRVQGSLEKGAKGNGLGLYISKTIVEMHHGRIWVESEAGKGSTFSFSLPFASRLKPSPNTGFVLPAAV